MAEHLSLVDTQPETVRFCVYGKAQPAGSKRSFRHPHTGKIVVVDANPRAQSWKQDVAAMAIRCGAVMFDGPVSLTLTFYVRRPKSHMGSGRNAGHIKPSAPTWPTGRPDTLKLARGVEDALTSICWRDDAQVCVQHAVKVYGEPERCEVAVSPLG